MAVSPVQKAPPALMAETTGLRAPAATSGASHCSGRIATMRLKDLAEHLGLSQTTVSRALNGYPEVNEATRRRVAEAANLLGYRPNASALRLATGRAGAIGLVLRGADELGPHMSEFLSGVGSYIRDRDHMEKAFALGGMPARNGVTAALLVHAGFSGVEDVFQGERNFLQAYSSDPKPGELVADLGSRFEIQETSIKKFCAGSPIQAPLEALLAIISNHNLEARDVQQLTVRLPEPNARTVDNRHMPDVNLQHILSIALLDGELTFAAAHSHERMHDPRVLEVASRVQLIPDPDLVDDRFPRQAIVEIVTSDGKRLKKHVRAYRGEASNPMTIEEVEAKARELMIPVIGKDQCNHLIAMVRDLEQVTDMCALRAALTKAGDQ